MNKKEYKIVIPDDLTPDQELVHIANNLRQKFLGDSKQKRLGDSVNVKNLTTRITIERKGAKPIEIIVCNVCNGNYQSDMFKPVWTNYGGSQKLIKTCSEQCQQNLIDYCGEGRAAKSRTKLKSVRIYN